MKHSKYLLIIIIIFLQTSTYVSAQIKVACIGNSITYGIGLTNEEMKDRTYPLQLQKLLNEHFIGKTFKVVNYGVSGTTMLKDPNDGGALDGDQWSYWESHEGPGDGGKEQYDLALASVPDIVIIKFGTNDARFENWRSAEGYGKNNFYNHYVEFINSFRVKNPNVIIYICYSTPSFRNQTDDQMRRIREEVIPIIKQLARKNRVHLIDLHSRFFDGYNKGLMDDDKVHPNVEGATLIADEVFKMIKMTYNPN